MVVVLTSLFLHMKCVKCPHDKSPSTVSQSVRVTEAIGLSLLCVQYCQFIDILLLRCQVCQISVVFFTEDVPVDKTRVDRLINQMTEIRFTNIIQIYICYLRCCHCHQISIFECLSNTLFCGFFSSHLALVLINTFITISQILFN